MWLNITLTAERINTTECSQAGVSEVRAVGDLDRLDLRTVTAQDRQDEVGPALLSASSDLQTLQAGQTFQSSDETASPSCLQPAGLYCQLPESLT